MNPLQMMMGPMMQNIGQLNPMVYLMQHMQNGGNPQQIIQQMAQQNPQFRRALPFFEGKNSKQIESTARNMLKERGLDPDEIRRQFEKQYPYLKPRK